MSGSAKSPRRAALGPHAAARTWSRCGPGRRVGAGRGRGTRRSPRPHTFPGSEPPVGGGGRAASRARVVSAAWNMTPTRHVEATHPARARAVVDPPLGHNGAPVLASVRRIRVDGRGVEAPVVGKWRRWVVEVAVHLGHHVVHSAAVLLRGAEVTSHTLRFGGGGGAGNAARRWKAAHGRTSNMLTKPSPKKSSNMESRGRPSRLRRGNRESPKNSSSPKGRSIVHASSKSAGDLLLCGVR